MKKLTCLPAGKVLSIITLFVFLFLATFSNANAQSSDCWEEFSNVKPICDQAATKNISCTDPDLNSPCHQDTNRLLDKCDQANNILHTCLGLDKESWKLESKNPGHLTCQEWKMLGIAGTAKNCVFPLTEISEKILWCLDSAAEVSQARGHQVDYILDFDPDKCFPTTEDDLRQFKTGLPQTSGSSPEVSQKTAKNSIGQKPPSPFNIFGINPYHTWLNLRELVEVGAYMKSEAIIQDAEYLASPGYRARLNAEAESKKLFEEAKFIEESTARFAELNLQDKIKANEIIKKFDARVEAVNKPILIKKDSATIELYPMNGQKGVLEQNEYWPMLKSGALDVIVKPQNGQKFELQTPNAEIFVIGTEFSIIYNPKEDQTLVAVYKGQVEVKTKDGQTAIVSPDGDKPGVVLVIQKLSVIKLVLAGLGLIIVIVGVVFFLKRRGNKTIKIKKKKMSARPFMTTRYLSFVAIGLNSFGIAVSLFATAVIAADFAITTN